MSVKQEWDMECPDCGSDDGLYVEVKVMARLSEDGTEPDGDQEWDEDSICSCQCGYTGIVSDFKPAFTAKMLDDLAGVLETAHGVAESTTLEADEADDVDTAADVAKAAVDMLVSIHTKLRVLGFHKDEHIQAADMIEPITTLYGQVDAALLKIAIELKKDE